MNKDSQPSKDIVYIDVEDDVTSVIGKVRASDQKIVALVPPKNIGSLQSAVNLRLIQKAADSVGKRIVLITSNSGLTALAAGVKIPIAKNLQSKPEIPTAAPVVSSAEEDVINGDELPVGELAAATNEATPAALATVGSAATLAPKPSDDDFTITGLPDDLNETATPTAAVAGTSATKNAKNSRVPNFGRFRKWFFIGGGLLIAIIAFFVLTNIFWTGARIVISAQTSDQPLDLPVTLTADGATNPDQGTIKAVSKQLKKTASVDFTPTGTKNVGDKATGTVKFTNAGSSSVTIAAGAPLTSTSGLVFTPNADVTIPAATLSFSCGGICPSSVTAPVTAAVGGTTYNGASGPLSGTPNGVSAAFTTPTSGGSDKTATVVTADDVTAATAKLAASNADAAKSELAGQFDSGYVVITNSFTSSDATPVSTPAVGAQATTAKLTHDSTYTIVAVSKSEIKTATTASVNAIIAGNPNQKIYNDGSSGASISQFVVSPSGVMTAHIKATGKVGPNINEATLKTQLVGKKAAEITQQIKTIGGVKDVTVSFAPFWRNTAPSSDKIKISFDLSNGN